MLTINDSHFLLVILNIWYNNAKTGWIHQGGCLVDEKRSLSRFKIVQYGRLTLCFRQLLNNCFILVFAILL